MSRYGGSRSILLLGSRDSELNLVEFDTNTNIRLVFSVKFIAKSTYILSSTFESSNLGSIDVFDSVRVDILDSDELTSSD